MNCRRVVDLRLRSPLVKKLTQSFDLLFIFIIEYLGKEGFGVITFLDARKPKTDGHYFAFKHGRSQKARQHSRRN